MANFLKKILNLFKNFEFEETKNILHYFTNGETLPNAPTEEEEKLLVERLMAGDDEAKNTLIEKNIRLVIFIAKKFEHNDLDMEDIVSIGSIGLIKAINSFNGDKNIKIATYASRCIENEILMYLRKINRQRGEISIDDAFNVDGEGNELQYLDLVASDDDTPHFELEKITERQILWQILDRLNSREKEIMILRFGLSGDDEKTQKEVADDLGISQSYISRLEKRIVSQIKKEMLKMAN
ncbi:MAG: sigma-70 family RNA polymerase sigma factor [Clostridiales bacterium]|nr:sigma-70 family RNA polymerase sigma factor [Clostridiales bacterium]